ncbi:unnamed protein product [Lampetra planeri]
MDDNSRSSLESGLLEHLGDHFHVAFIPGGAEGGENGTSSPLCLWALAREHHEKIESVQNSWQPRLQVQPTRGVHTVTSRDPAECEKNNNRGFPILAFEQLDEDRSPAACGMDSSEETGRNLAVEGLSPAAVEWMDATRTTGKPYGQEESATDAVLSASIGPKVKLASRPSMFAAVLCHNVSPGASKCSPCRVKFWSFAYERQARRVRSIGWISCLNSSKGPMLNLFV